MIYDLEEVEKMEKKLIKKTNRKTDFFVNDQVKHIVMKHGCEFLGESCLFARLAAVNRLKNLITKEIDFRKINLRENHLRSLK